MIVSKYEAFNFAVHLELGGNSALIVLDDVDLLNGRRIVGITEGDSDPEQFIPALVRLYELGRLPLDKLIRHPFGQIEQAAIDAHDGSTIKPVLTYN